MSIRTGNLQVIGHGWLVCIALASVTLLLPERETSLISMPLRSLVFSSDRGTAHLLTEALYELGMQVEHCPEIFGAVERLTLQCFDVLVVDWNDEPEASFLLRAAREMKSAQPPFPVAVVELPATVNEARRAGANHVLVKAQARNDLFQLNGRSWGQELPALDHVGDVLTQVQTAPQAAQASPPEKPASRATTGYLPQEPLLSFAGYATSRSKARSKSHKPSNVGRPQVASGRAGKNALAFLTLVFAVGVSVWRLGPFAGSAFPAVPASAIFSKAVTIPLRLSEKVERWWNHSPNGDDDAAAGSAPEQISVNPSRVAKRPVVKPSPVSLASLQAGLPGIPVMPTLSELRPSPPLPTSSPETANIPESLKRPPEGLSVRNVVASSIPTLLGALEPVLIPEEISRKLLLQKVQPSYPEQAIRAGLQGPVVLQAWIGRDGKIRDLKLVRGYLVLGRAAVDAVKQWRYQPYLRNGQALETQTYITVNFSPDSPADQNR